METGCGTFIVESVVGTALQNWVVLTKTSPVTYKIQCHAGDERKIVHVHKLPAYQSGEFHSWLEGEELE